MDIGGGGGGACVVSIDTGVVLIQQPLQRHRDPSASPCVLQMVSSLLMWANGGGCLGYLGPQDKFQDLSQWPEGADRASLLK